MSSEDDETTHYCEVCDREFLTIELLERHNDTHKTCGIDGCTFSAHPKLVEKHISMQHYTGLYHRMKNLSTPEDVQKWIVERKKKYPTKTNVEKKRAEQMEKRERGEIIAKEEKSRVTKKPIREKKRKIRNRKPREFKEKPKEIVELYRGLLQFAGVANLRESVNEIVNEQSEIMEETENAEMLTAACPISDDEDETNKLQSSAEDIQFPEKQPTNEIKSGLASLLANYGSDTDSQDEGPAEVPIKRMKTDESPENVEVPNLIIAESINARQKITQDVTNSISANPKTLPSLKDNEQSSKDKKSSKEEKSPREEKSKAFIPTRMDNSRYCNKKRLMLLQRLLSRSIQHERNLICQCIKYIADNNFFDD